MALQIDITTSDMVNHPTAYAAISINRAEYMHTEANINIKIWHNQSARGTGKDYATPVKEISFLLQEEAVGIYPAHDTILGNTVISAADMNPRKSLYNWIKTQSDLQGIDFTVSTDILEE